ncbi:hypothetical protein [Corynebacterium variabile]|uniref:hypothetical protein n=1 Tax=Corynebacterium variabile TaxID=1727 RepID=UPI0028ED47BC|nr:hypothetical protein [Corynebacterium variabile]
MPPSPHARSIHRRVFLAGAGLTGTAAVGGLAALHFLSDSSDDSDAPDTPAAVDPGDLQLITGDASHPGRVTVTTADGRELVHFDGYRFSGNLGTRGATVDTSSPGTVHVDFEVPGDGYTAAVTWRAVGGTVTGDWEFTLPGDADEDALSGGRMIRTLIDADPTVQVPATRWARDPRGGVPYLERVTEHIFTDWAVDDARICGVFTVAGCRDSIPTSIHVPPTRGDDGIWRATVVFRTDPAVAEARELVHDGRLLLAGGVLGHPELPEPLIDVHFPDTYNVFEESGTRTVTVGVAGAPGETAVDLLVRDYDGAEVHHSSVTVSVPDSVRHQDAQVKITLPDDRNWYCLDVTSGSSFARTTAAVWPRYDFGPAEQSIIGLGGFSTLDQGSQEPGLEPVAEERALWERLGVRHLRNPWLSAEESEATGIRTGLLPSGTPGQFDDPDAQSFDDWTEDALTRGEDSGVEIYELLNEWNARGSGDEISALATEYSDRWLVPFHAAKERTGSDAALLAASMAGWDSTFLDTLRDRGSWELLDGIAEHAGRGNYTADYDGATWNFLGQTRQARAYLDEHPGPDQLWLTEAYACTRPNTWWNDPPRVAADAVFLSLLLAKACNVKGVHWYQLTDGLWHDKYGVDPSDPEYHYGLFHVDRSPKPSAAAFAHASEVLDGASFLGWLESVHPDLHGLRFTTGGREVRVLWSRQSGYITNATRVGTDFHPFPEPWETSGEPTLRVSVPDGATCSDVLGRPVAVTDGAVEVGGSPVTVVDDAGDGDWPAVVDGEASVALTGVSVRRDGTSLTVDGDNATGGTLTLRITGRQVGGEVTETELKVPEGGFSESVDLGEAMPEDGSAVGVNPGQPAQVRILAERREKLTPEAAQPQVWRAEYYRSV